MVAAFQKEKPSRMPPLPKFEAPPPVTDFFENVEAAPVLSAEDFFDTMEAPPDLSAEVFFEKVKDEASLAGVMECCFDSNNVAYYVEL